MTDRLALLAQEAVRRAVSRELGYLVEYHARLPSTQDRALALAPEPALIVADVQSAGQGTHGRSWETAPGAALLCSIVQPAGAPNAHVASLAAGVAVARAAGPDARVKWPNDVVIGGRKVAGILTHLSGASAAAPGAVEAPSAGTLVVGIGINVAGHPDLPEAASLGAGVDRLDLLARVVRELERALADPAMLDEWRERSSVLGREVIVERTGEPGAVGVASALDPDGALVIRTAYGTERIVSGRVRTL